MVEPSIKGCALRFLDQWILDEKPLVEGLNPITGGDQQLQLLQRAMRYFSIARNFPRTGDVEKNIPRFRPVLEALQQLGLEMEDVETVNQLEANLSTEYWEGRTRLVSAASKLVWLLKRGHVVIYDSLVRQSLGLGDVGYGVYYEAWMTEYARSRNQIIDACVGLPRVCGYGVAGGQLEPEEVRKLAAESWFQMRVFDTYHWFRGSLALRGAPRPMTLPSS